MKPQYRMGKWSEDNAGLKQRGSLTFWIEESVLEAWIVEDLSGKPGASKLYSDLAIMTMATLKAVYHLAGRQCQGFVESIFELMGIDLPAPDHSTLSRRLGQLSIELPVILQEGARHGVVDSTGVKVYGEGEWKTRQHGVSKRRTWRKLHLGVDEATGEILAAVVTTNDFHDGEVLRDILEQIEEPIEQVTTDGAYDHAHCYDEIAEREAKAVIPPRKDAVVWQHGNRKAPPHPRDENLRLIRKHGRKKWKRDSNYTSAGYSFAALEKNKIWLWTAVDHFKAGILAWVIDDHRGETFKPLWHIVCLWQCFFSVTGGNQVYPSFIAEGDQMVSQTDMTRVEGENTRLRNDLARLHRKT